jgi:nicotinate-nucleotide adenylyltransferase
MRIGLLGGSFNPPHAAHRLISVNAMKRLKLDRIWWLVTPGNPLKSHAELADLRQRLALAEAAARHPRIAVTGFEAQLPSAYTARTLKILKRRRPGVCFVWLMGADNLAGFHLWRDWRRILEIVPVAVADRPGWRNRALNSPAARALASFRLDEQDAAALPCAPAPAWVYLSGPLSPLSSTALRKAQRRSS